MVSSELYGGDVGFVIAAAVGVLALGHAYWSYVSERRRSENPYEFPSFKEYLLRK